MCVTVRISCYLLISLSCKDSPSEDSDEGTEEDDDDDSEHSADEVAMDIDGGSSPIAPSESTHHSPKTHPLPSKSGSSSLRVVHTAYNIVSTPPDPPKVPLTSSAKKENFTSSQWHYFLKTSLLHC